MPRLEVRLDLLAHNAATLVGRLAGHGIGVTAVTKATLASPDVARVLLAAGAAGLGESRVENVERLRAAGITAPITLLRAPMLSQVDRVVAAADVSLNTEPDVLAALSAAAVRLGRTHGVVLMVELGDLREGILPADLARIARQTLDRPGLDLRGIGTNLACQRGTVPDAANMDELSDLARSLEGDLGVRLLVVSGGNSANLDWLRGPSPQVGRINDLRLGESILLGREPLHRQPIYGLHLDAFTLVGEVIEAKAKPSVGWGRVAQTAFGPTAPAVDRGATTRVLVALGRQDVDPDGLTPPPGFDVLGASSDHLVLDAGDSTVPVGTLLRFGLDYAALLRAAASPSVAFVSLEGPA
ncbi:alanine/ornithine racemase family PLP-dependent enzyme [Aquihabitans sp. McL0605]|uniref:alanine/ornithine racemase family PLP-dependent enzyme n=1 Tax=Aquihabitans sp. McL0605 TaxID=3415671 RepID=UPI003CFAE752